MSKLTPKTKADLRTRRHARIRAKVAGTAERPRLAIFLSNTAVYAQVIDDDKGVTLASASKKAKNTLTAKEVGEKVAKAAKEKGITKVVFDRGGFGYSARVKALADAAREAGLEF